VAFVQFQKQLKNNNNNPKAAVSNTYIEKNNS